MNSLIRLFSEVKNIAKIGGATLATRYAASIVRNLPGVIKSGSLRCVDGDIAGTGQWFVARTSGVSLQVPAKSISLVREIYGRNSYRPCDLFGIERGQSVVDLGANCGIFTVLAAKLGARVLAVECQYSFLAELQEILERNGCEACLEWGLVGPRTGMFADTDERKRADHFGDPVPPELSMTELLDRYEIIEVDLLKCDIEGSEFDLFRDAQWFSRVRRIAMEVHPAFGDPAVLRDDLVRRGFAVKLRNAELDNGLITNRGGFLYATR